jgi:hypothetical protein
MPAQGGRDRWLHAVKGENDEKMDWQDFVIDMIALDWPSIRHTIPVSVPS